MVTNIIFPSLFTRSEEREVQRSVDRVSRSARDINANALAQMHSGLTHPGIASLSTTLLRKEGKGNSSKLNDIYISYSIFPSLFTRSEERAGPAKRRPGE
jgi:hypothetical protein